MGVFVDERRSVFAGHLGLRGGVQSEQFGSPRLNVDLRLGGPQNAVDGVKVAFADALLQRVLDGLAACDLGVEALGREPALVFGFLARRCLSGGFDQLVRLGGGAPEVGADLVVGLALTEQPKGSVAAIVSHGSRCGAGWRGGAPSGR